VTSSPALTKVSPNIFISPVFDYLIFQKTLFGVNDEQSGKRSDSHRGLFRFPDLVVGGWALRLGASNTFISAIRLLSRDHLAARGMWCLGYIKNQSAATFTEFCIPLNHGYGTKGCGKHSEIGFGLAGTFLPPIASFGWWMGWPH